RTTGGVPAPCRRAAALSKVIIEAALLTDEEKVSACVLSKAAGADYVKTSTGFGPGGATVAGGELMSRVSAGANRVGASAGVKIIQQSKGDAQPSASTPGTAPSKSLY